MSSLLVIFLASLAVCRGLEHADEKNRGFIALVRRVLDQDAPNDVELSLYNVDARGYVNITLLKNDNDTVISEKTVHVGKENKVGIIKLPVPRVEDYEARIQIHGAFETEDMYTFFGEDKVNFRLPPSWIIFLQTDKPIYKPGQTVNFRQLPVDSRLRPVHIICDLWVEDTEGSRIAQWKNVSFEKGIRQFSIPLSNEPNLGFWRIRSICDKTETSASFEVKEYVLPKFEVTIEPPPYILADSDTCEMKVCARYTYGKQVIGSVHVEVTLETYSWSNNKFPILEFDGEINGCYPFTVNLTGLDPEFQYSYRRIQITTSVTEKGTDVVRNETKYVDRTQSPLSINFQSQSEYFRPGLAYNGAFKTTNPDGSPAPDEPCEVCAIVQRERELAGWWANKKLKHCRNLTSDSNGITTFTIPPQKTDTISMYIEAKSLKYTGKTPRLPKRPILYQPQSTSYLRPWFSPSGSHIQIQSSGEEIKCGTKAKITFLFTSKESGDFHFVYKVISKGSIVKKGTHHVNFDVNDSIDVSSNDTLDAKNIQLVPAVGKSQRMTSEESGDGRELEESDEENNCKAVKESKYVPFIGKSHVEIDVAANLAPKFIFLLYYIRQDRETVADSLSFDVEKCFDNKVGIEFGDKVQQPGLKTTISIIASPNSLCGLKVVDKSISLLDSGDQLTKNKVYDELNRFDPGQTYPRNHCNDNKPQAGISRKASFIMPPNPGWSSSPFEDAITAIEKSGYLVISDLTFFTRPCKNSDGAYRPYGGAGGGAFAAASVGVRQGAHATTVASRRPIPAANTFAASPPASNIAESADFANEKVALKSVVDIRDFFPETWLWELNAIDSTGKLVMKKTLPHTITQWDGSVVCVNEIDGLGLSETAHINALQEFFVSFTLPYSCIKNETIPVIVTVFNYIDKCLPIKLELRENSDFVLLNETNTQEVCVCGGMSETVRFNIRPYVISTTNITVFGSSTSSDVCGDKEISTSVAKDAITNPLIIEPAGFKQEIVTNYLLCTEEAKDWLLSESFLYDVPEDLEEGSAKPFFIITGDIMGPTIDNLGNLVQVPTGCGEQNMVLFAPNVNVLDYMYSINKIDEALVSKAKGNLRTGYQRQLTYRHSDGSYSAFGKSDSTGSTFLTAFVLGCFAQARQYIDIDENSLKETADWIVNTQTSAGCFPEIGRTLSYSLKGGLKSSNSSASLTSYVLVSLLKYGFQNKTVEDNAFACIAEEKVPSAYQAALFAYTAAIAKREEEAKDYLNFLYKYENTTNGLTYFPDKDNNTATNIETAAFAILAQVELGIPEEKILTIVRWLTKKRNSNGGFVSTQDTVWALEALSEFASKLHQEKVDLDIKLGGDVKETELHIGEDDRLIVHKFPVSNIPAEVTFNAKGKGCILLQSVLIYAQNKPHKDKYFNLDIRTTKEGCKTANIRVCTSYLKESENSSMALVQVNMITGKSPNKDSVDAILANSDLGIKKYEFKENEANFYFDQLTNAQTCFEFKVDDVYDVTTDVKPGKAKVFDYYFSDRLEQTTYTIEDCPKSP